MPQRTPAQQYREKPEPSESSRDVPMFVLLFAAGLVIFGIYYIVHSGPLEPPEYGDRRTINDLVAHRAAGAGGAVDGKAVYAARCVACHQPTGAGLPGVFPPLAESEWVTGKEDVIVQIILHGVHGALTVKGATYNGAMPGFGTQMSDAEIAAVATFVRSQWGNTAPPVNADKVAKLRADTAARKEPWNGDAELTPLR